MQAHNNYDEVRYAEEKREKQHGKRLRVLIL